MIKAGLEREIKDRVGLVFIAEENPLPWAGLGEAGGDTSDK